jgi:hypothetical protein
MPLVLLLGLRCSLRIHQLLILVVHWAKVLPESFTFTHLLLRSVVRVFFVLLNLIVGLVIPQVAFSSHAVAEVIVDRNEVVLLTERFG